jgi:hypothetical protein
MLQVLKNHKGLLVLGYLQYSTMHHTIYTNSSIMCCRLKVSSCTTGGCTAWSAPYRVAVTPATPTVHRLDSGPGGQVGTTGQPLFYSWRLYRLVRSLSCSGPPCHTHSTQAGQRSWRSGRYNRAASLLQLAAVQPCPLPIV